MTPESTLELTARLEHLELDRNQIANVLAIIAEQRDADSRALAALREKMGPLLQGIATGDMCIARCTRFNGVIITPGINHDLLPPPAAAGCLKILTIAAPAAQTQETK